MDVNQVKALRKNEVMSEKIEVFLKTRGFNLEGGSIDKDGTVFISIDTHGAGSFGRMGDDLKEYLGVPKLVMDGIPY